ncbi:hypothetical protein EG347_11090 [Chryseobacterium sp. G0186]|uniref:hypothetical protein n=1 Tax=Chryseobacterium sp. G0186 TaxID=2487064 RepID=UPI000F4F599B|nr:hypothetical protein [Chryseobacterium sp. G0186]AZA78023.1 hypothetical protein EG347_11090 [Chryseobacterium sp. G0186]
MSATIEIKNKTNWILTFVMSIGLLLSFSVIFILILFLFGTILENDFSSVLNYLSFIIPFAGFFTLFLYFWLWNTFGKTILNIEPGTITISYKNKLFTSPTTFLKQEIEDIQIRDYSIQHYKYGVRYHFSWTGATYSIILVKRDEEKRIINWITEDKASEILGKIKKVWSPS